MGYRQLSIEERCEVPAYVPRAPRSGKSPSGSRAIDGGSGVEAQWVTIRRVPISLRARTGQGTALDGGLERDDDLRGVLERLSWRSPEQIAGHLAEAAGRTVISYESIYRFIYAQAARHKNHAWRRYLPRAKWKRGRRRRKGSSASFIAHRRPVAERPAAAADRQTFGHWEADTMLFGRSGEVVLALHERLSRLVLMARVPSKAAGPIAETIARVLGPLPPAFRQTVTFDNGTEFARHHELHDLGIETFFCDTYSPWQKGGVENAIGRLRRFLPRKMNLAEVPEERFTEVALAYNNTPRKCLGYRSSAEIFKTRVLHFKCEFTFPVRGNDG